MHSKFDSFFTTDKKNWFDIERKRKRKNWIGQEGAKQDNNGIVQLLECHFANTRAFFSAFFYKQLFRSFAFSFFIFSLFLFHLFGFHSSLFNIILVGIEKKKCSKGEWMKARKKRREMFDSTFWNQFWNGQDIFFLQCEEDSKRKIWIIF